MEPGALFRQAPVIVSEMRLDFSELHRTNERIVNAVVDANTDLLSKVGFLEQLLPGLRMAGDCACACACACSCSCS